MTIQLMFITNDADIAKEAEASGVDRIFIDLEKIGKWERQGHLDTVLSSHSMSDISTVRAKIEKCELLVRINPVHEHTASEIDEAIDRGADVLMLPMFTTAEEVAYFVARVGGRAKTCLLLETPQALVRINEILDIKGIDEVHLGLNDLYLGMKLDFMFELISCGVVDFACRMLKARGIKYGFGGIAKIGKGVVPAEMILAEHYRLGSEMVILSRSFHNRAVNLEELRQRVDFGQEVRKIRERENAIRQWSSSEMNSNFNKIKSLVQEHCRCLRREKWELNEYINL
ncbi:aldolase/citrate lyase family protein [Cohnella yongneupensis]|uniref:Aldolase/citrate lyase family protein n=1 Tax=Cohnella yongneupensis TaxID=425006 RepID=A0ABW0R331_9BACL